MRRLEFTLSMLVLLSFFSFSIYIYVENGEGETDAAPAQTAVPQEVRPFRATNASLPCSDAPTSNKDVAGAVSHCAKSIDQQSADAQPDVDASKQLVSDALLDKRKGLALSNLIGKQKDCFGPQAAGFQRPQNCLAVARAYPLAIQELGTLAKGGDMESEYFLAKLIIDSIFDKHPIDSATLSYIDKNIRADRPEWIDHALAWANDSANQGYGPAIAMRKKFGFLRP